MKNVKSLDLTGLIGCWKPHPISMRIPLKKHFSTKNLKKIAKIAISTAFCGKVKFSLFSTFFPFSHLGDNFPSLCTGWAKVIHKLSFALPQAIHILNSWKKSTKSRLCVSFPQSPQPLLFTKTNYLLINLFHYIRYL